MTRRFTAFFVLAFLSVPALGAETHTVTLADYDRIREIGPPVLSRDGGQVAYVFEDRIWVAAAEGDPQPVTSAASKASEPTWSRDGDALWFLSDRSGTKQVWKLELESFGEAVQVTDLEGGVDTLELSPDETRLLLGYDDESRPGKDNGGAGEEKKKPLPQPFVIDRLQFKEDAGDGYLTSPPSHHVYVYDLEAEKLQQVTRGDHSESEAQFSPDGKRIAFVSSRDGDPDASYRTDLWIVDADGGEPVRLTASDEPKSAPAWSPDGRWIAYRSAVDGVYGIERLTIVPAGGGEPTLLTEELDRWVRDFRFSADGRWIYFVFDDHGARRLARVRIDDGRIERLLEGERVVSAFDVDDAANVVVRANGPNDAADLYRLRRGGLDRLTNVNGAYLAEVRLGEKTKESYTVADGTVVETFITTPPGYEEGRRYPAVLKIHGGPVGQFEWGYDFGTQFLAANGYVVVEPNPRGSTGRGQAFVNAIYRTWGITDYVDVIGAIEHAVEAGYADRERLAVTGYSYGGYMTNVVITRTGMFKAAASGAGHAFIAANYGHDIYQRWYNWELGTPWENRELYDRLSPLLHAGEVVTPTIFLGGRLDWNVPILNSELFYQSLKTRGIDTRLVVYPGMHHGGWDPRFEQDYLRRVVAWFDRYVKGT